MTALEPAREDAPVLVLRASRWRVALIGLGGVALVGCGVLMIVRGGDPVTVGFGWIATLFFAACTLAAAAQALRPTRLELDGHGFTLTVAGREPRRILWADVEALFVWRAHSNRFVAWNFRPGRRPPGPIHAVNAALGAQGMLPPGWPVKADALAALMERMRQEAALAEQRNR